MNKATTKIYRSDGRFYLYLPRSLFRDSAFPFSDKDRTLVTIEGGTVTIRRREKCQLVVENV